MVTGAALAFATVPALTAHAAGATGVLRADQAGFLPGDTKIAYLMTSAAVSGATYQVVNAAGTAVAGGTVTSTSRGSWNTAYPDVYPIDFSTVTAAGTYRVVVSGALGATSDTFKIADAGTLYGALVADGVNFYQNQRDGANVIPGALNRQPSHLNDASASVYQNPTFKSPNSDVITGSSLTKIGGPVDVSGGWFDAGDYLKFTFTASYADDLLYASARALGPNAPASLAAEAQYGTSWLDKMWNPTTKTLYLQVGIGSGNETTFFGDHDLWRLPQADDSDTTSGNQYAAAHRPVFEAAAPGAKIDPDIVGRVAAAFAFAAQADAAGNPARAATELGNATSLYAMADTSPSTLGSVLPTSYYPESIWHDAMELGATEIALAQQDLGNPGSTYLPYLTQAATWASDYLKTDTGQDTLNLYDVSALAHADLKTALGNAGNPSGLAVSGADLVANLKAQVASAASKSATDVFRAGGNYADFDVDSHTFGFISTEALYEKASGDTQYAAFAGQQRDWLLGGNPWGTSFVVGVGTTFPNCMQSQIPNLAGSLDGSSPVDTGAVVNGPNNISNFKGGLGGLQDGMKSCENDSGTAFTGHSSEYVDDVRSWQTDEPALDMSGSAILSGALQESLGPVTPPGDDFSLSVAPASGSVNAGTSGSLSAAVSTAVASGSAENVALTTSGAPAGVTAALSPTSVTSGGASTLTLTTTAAAAAGTYPITVTGTAASGSHTAVYNLAITPGTGGGANSYEAEAATLAGGASVTSCAACSGSQKVTGIGGSTHGTATFAGVSEASAGSYTLTVSYLSASKDRSAVVTINGTSQTVSFPATATGVVGTLTISVQLKAGTNTIAFGGSGSGKAPDLDRIVV